MEELHPVIWCDIRKIFLQAYQKADAIQHNEGKAVFVIEVYERVAICALI